MKKQLKIILIIMGLLIIISSVTIPLIINNNIKKEKEADLKAINSIVKIIEEDCKKSDIGNDDEKTSKYYISDNKLYVDSIKNESSLSVDDPLPDKGIIELDKECNISLSVIYGKYNIIKKVNEEAKIIDYLEYKDGDILYFNPETNKICNDYEESNSENLNRKGCMKWYTFGDERKNNTIKLLLDHNTTSSIRWISKNDYKIDNDNKEYSNSQGAITLLKKLDNDTSSWNVKARLITIDEIKDIIGLTKTGDDKNYFFDSLQENPLKKCYKGDITECRYGWLYDRTSINTKEYGGLNNAIEDTYGYWTDSKSDNDNEAWRVYFDGRIVSTKIDDIGSGIRPVIEIQKSLLK